MATLNFLTKFSVAITATTALGFFASSANALSLTGSSGTWSNPVGGSNIKYQTVGTGVPQENQIRWGKDVGNGQSGLGFKGVGSVDFDVNTVFQIGSLTHYNNAIAAGTAASKVDLGLKLNFNSLPITSQTFNFSFNIDETLNSGKCAYGSNSQGCADKITFSTPKNFNTFSIAGVDYTLQLLGFREKPTSTTVTNFISQEGRSNSAFLYAKITAVPPKRVPESSSALGVVAFGALAASSMLNQKQRVKATAKV
ncbi:THxN family PEP-CTERM protein [Calothrix sp. FACHB-156]|nr:THxN family PEP-CTERM protein [Nostoc linckia FACHB-104]MBD2335945.1 THxN family PEP-CTERM protein [Calothrix sp. FACHB-156]